LAIPIGEFEMRHRYSLPLPAPYSLQPTAYSLQPTAYSLHRTRYTSSPTLPGFWSETPGERGRTPRRSLYKAFRFSSLYLCLLRVVVPDHGLGDDAVHCRPRGLHLRSPLWLGIAGGGRRAVGVHGAQLRPSAPVRSTPRPTHPPASRVGPVLPRRSARAALRTSRASCPGPVYVS